MKLKQIIVYNFSMMLVSAFIYVICNTLYLAHINQLSKLVVRGNEQEVIASSQITVELFHFRNLVTDQSTLERNYSAIDKTIHTMDSLFTRWFNALQFELQHDSEQKEVKNKVKKYEKMYADFSFIKTAVQQLSSLPTDEKEKLLVKQVAPVYQNLIQQVIDNSIAAQKEFQEESIFIQNSLMNYGWVNLSIIIILASIVLYIAFYLMRTILTSLEKFTGAIEQMAQGNFDIRIDINNNTEFGTLATLFNKMSTELANTKSSIESIINTMPNYLFVTDDNLTIKQVNDRVYKELGFTRNEIIGTSFSKLLPDQIVSDELKQLSHDEVFVKRFTLQVKTNSIPVIFSSTVMTLNDQSKLLLHIAQDVSQLKKMETELLATARKAGMADIATSTLHNVGNILNSINTSISVIENKANKNPIAGLNKIVELLQNNPTIRAYFNDDEKGKLIPAYLLAMVETWQQQYQSIIDEINLLKRNIAHIINIITAQQKMTKIAGSQEVIDLKQLIHDAIEICYIPKAHTNINIIKKIDLLPTITIDAAKLMQVLVNIIKNALQALAKSATHEKCLQINVSKQDAKYFKIEIADNGIGIKAENITKIFSHGFTTKENGHGFGLHSCAIAIKEMAGTIEAKSEGEERGATFIIILPYKGN